MSKFHQNNTVGNDTLATIDITDTTSLIVKVYQQFPLGIVRLYLQGRELAFELDDGHSA